MILRKVKYFFIFLFGILFSHSLLAQDYFKNNSLNDGAYKYHSEFIDNAPSYEIIEKKPSTLLVRDAFNDSLELQTSQVWGYTLNNNVYISHEGNFWKLINRGKLNHFTAIVLHYYQTVDPYGFAVERVSRSMVHFFFERESGEIFYLNKENLKKFLDDDPILKKYYKKLKGNKTERLILTLKAYNERNP